MIPTAEEILRREIRMIKNANSWLKGFDDLKFETHPMAKGIDKVMEKVGELSTLKDMQGSKQAMIRYEDGGWISVCIGKMFYSNGKDNYELFTSKLYDPYGYISRNEVEMCMYKFQLENPRMLLVEDMRYASFIQRVYCEDEFSDIY